MTDWKNVAELVQAFADDTIPDDGEQHGLELAAKLCDREALVQELLDACEHTRREPTGRVMRAVKAVREATPP